MAAPADRGAVGPPEASRSGSPAPITLFAMIEGAAPKKDEATVTPSGERRAEIIEGVRLRPAVTQVDERGSICEVYDPAWAFTEEPLVYVYLSTVRPQSVKGWVVHLRQDDRLFVSRGTAQVVLFDRREESPTTGLVNSFVIGPENRSLLRIPHGVYHAVANVGRDDAAFINMPTRPYQHSDPDKYRLPLDSDEIPFRFPPHFVGG
jgi:dTDP-4-dehydrorhamnose 3,5-epimerase